MTNTYVVGQWVRGDRFYGRSSLLENLVAAADPLLWLIGGRRIGKTSVLRQIEHLTAHQHSHVVPLFWDLQGADTPDELLWTLSEAFEDSPSIRQALGRRPPNPKHPKAIAESLETCGRELRNAGRTLLLLCDEAEELIGLATGDPETATSLFEVLASSRFTRTVLTGSVRLLELRRHAGFGNFALRDDDQAPVYLGPLDPTASRELVHQAKLPGRARPTVAPAETEGIRSACGDHPYLLQLVAKRFAEAGAIDRAISEVTADAMIEHFLAVDMDLLDEADRSLLRRVARCEGYPASPGEDQQSDLLVALGYLTRHDDGTLSIRNDFLAEWLAR